MAESTSGDTRTVDEMPLREVIREDCAAVVAKDPSASSEREVARNAVGFRAVRAYRRQHWLYGHGLQRLALRMARRSRENYGVEIHPAATIGRRFVIDHGMGVVIGGTAILGNDVMLYQGVTLGMTGKHGGKRHPTLGNNVMVGAGAKVLGDITLGDNSKVGANAVVVHDVPSDVTVAGVPARVVNDRRPQSLFLIKNDDLDLDDENIRWSCSL